MKYSNTLFIATLGTFLFFASIPAQASEKPTYSTYQKRRRTSPLTIKETEQMRLRPTATNVTTKDIEKFNKQQEKAATKNPDKKNKYWF